MHSATGTRTRVARVRAEYPNQLDYSGWITKSNLLIECKKEKRVNEPCADSTRERAHHENNCAGDNCGATGCSLVAGATCVYAEV